MSLKLKVKTRFPHLVSANLFSQRIVCAVVSILITHFSLLSNAQTIKSKADTTAILIGTPINFTIEINLPQGTSVAFPLWADTLGDGIDILEKSKIDTIKAEGKTDITLKQVLTVTALDSGIFYILPQRFIINKDSTKLLFTQPVQIKADFPKVALDKDIKDIKPPLAPPFDWIFWALIAVGVILVIVLAWLAYKIFKKKENPFAKIFEEKPIPPHERALIRLEQLRVGKLWQNNQEKLYHVEISEIVREYIEGRFKVNALEQVTDETLEEMKGKAEPRHLEQLKQILTLSDLVKFAKQQAGVGENELSLNNAFDFVKSTMEIVNEKQK